MISRSALAPTFLTAATAIGAGGAALLVSSLTPPSVHAGGDCELSSTIRSEFDATPIHAGRQIWFNATVQVTRPLDRLVTISYSSAQIEFNAGGSNYVLKVPASRITFDPTATTATTDFDEASERFETTVPASYTGNVFLTGLAYPVTTDLPGSIQPLTWTGVFESDTPDTSMEWQWAAAVYDVLDTDYDDLGIKPIDGDTLTLYANEDQAGTPENFTGLAVRGARGPGGSSYTGAYSGSRTESCP